jgi:hypothetical protein
MDMAYIEGSYMDDPELLQMILLNESVAGRYGRRGDTHFKNWRKRSYGIMQVQFRTAKFMMKRLTKHESKDRGLLFILETNDLFNMYIARKYCEYVRTYLEARMKTSVSRWHVLLAYNVGPRNVVKRGFKHDPNNYVQRAVGHLANTILPYNAPRKYKESLEYNIEKEKQKNYGNPTPSAMQWKVSQLLKPYSTPKPLSITNPLLR